MSCATDRATAWIYRGVWRAVVDWLLVPPAPTLPATGGDEPRVFHPAPGYLSYRKLWFWIMLLLIDGAITLIWVLIFLEHPGPALVLLPVILVVAIAPDVLTYIGLHLRYDMTWYMMNNRAVRVRHGVWVVTESTNTFENVQNVSVQSGPVQRMFGIQNLVIETAGGSAAPARQTGAANQSRLVGVAQAEQIRDFIMGRVRASKSAGLGDDLEPRERHRSGWSPAHLAVLTEIRDKLDSRLERHQA